MISLTEPFTRHTLNVIREALKPAAFSRHIANAGSNAGVLIPLCNVQNKPGILFQLRGKNLRYHSGEDSFPGGKTDQTDASYVATALRETHEELGILPSQVDILGEVGPPEMNHRGDLCVWPCVGFVAPMSSDEVLPSIDLAQLQLSEDEVDLVFHLPLTALTAPARLRSSFFRGQRPYFAIDVTDFVRCSVEPMRQEKPVEDDSEIGSGKHAGRVEIWGLTGWYLNMLMRTLSLYR